MFIYYICSSGLCRFYEDDIAYCGIFSPENATRSAFFLSFLASLFPLLSPSSFLVAWSLWSSFSLTRLDNTKTAAAAAIAWQPQITKRLMGNRA